MLSCSDARDKRHGKLRRQAGVTLIELIIAIVIISVASVALLQALGFQAGRNVDPMIQSQAQLVARQYLNEVLGKPFFDPAADPRFDSSLPQADVVNSIVDQSGSTLSPTIRIDWDNLYEYAGYSAAATDPSGNSVAGLEGYNVSIAIDISGGLALGSLTNSATANCPAQLALIEVTVTDPRGQNTQLSGYRTSYWATPLAWGC